MQISRHWRMNANRYRLQGFALPTGEKALQPRQSTKSDKSKSGEEVKTQEQRTLTAA